MVIEQNFRLTVDGTYKRHAPAGSQSCWLHFTAAAKPDLEQLLSSLSIHPLAQQRLMNGTDIPAFDEYEGCFFLSLFIVRPDSERSFACRQPIYDQLYR
ncbi:corA-like Mg2+ transporter family protein [Geobacillus kaustophilus]|uniref:CorA-like Mg2+ transporter family protein n=1 Tax=Geobacillus kaustophilus TaxID=1462 RepID=A0A0D8BTY5_GEOKU|nr:corA-like Mg2+ transporter family protein [Geobacillus kaustophilus]